MLYIFGDEDVRTDKSDFLYFYCAVAFYQSGFNANVNAIKKLMGGGTSLLEPIAETLHAAHGFALICHARVHEDLLPQGAVWSTNDIQGMSPKDFVWSVSMILTIAYLIRDLLDRRWRFKTADVFYDPKSLTKEHRAAMELVLQDRLRRHVELFIKRHSYEGKAKVRHVKAIEKPKHGYSHNKLQLGTWVADRIVRRSQRFSSLNVDRLLGKTDITQDVNAALNDFLNGIRLA